MGLYYIMKDYAKHSQMRCESYSECEKKIKESKKYESGFYRIELPNFELKTYFKEEEKKW